MIKKTKKMISVLLMLYLVSSFAVMPVSAAVYINEAKYNEAFTALANLGFISYTEGEIQVDQKMRRIEFVRLISKIYNDSFTADESNVFTDVYPDSDDAKLLDAAYSMNIVRGFGGEFRPEDTITFSDAVVMCARAIGYHTIDEHLTYSKDYISTAEKADILDNIANKGDNFTRADAYMMIYNTIKTDMFVPIGISGNTITYAREAGKTLLSTYHNVYYIEGQVTKTNVTGLVSDSLYEYGIEITDKDGISVQARCGMEYNDMIGMNVKALYRDDDRGDVELISCVIDEKRLEIIEISGDELISVDPDKRELRYEKCKYDSSGKKTSIKEKTEIIPVTANWIYNGQYVSDVKSNVLEKLEQATEFTTDLNIYQGW